MDSITNLELINFKSLKFLSTITWSQSFYELTPSLKQLPKSLEEIIQICKLIWALDSFRCVKRSWLYAISSSFKYNFHHFKFNFWSFKHMFTFLFLYLFHFSSLSLTLNKSWKICFLCAFFLERGERRRTSKRKFNNFLF